MAKRFVVLLNGWQATPEARNAISQAIKELKVSWWHWFPDVWLLKDRSGTKTKAELRDLVRAASGGMETLVIEIDDTPPLSYFLKPDHHRWIRETWSKP